MRTERKREREREGGGEIPLLFLDSDIFSAFFAVSDFSFLSLSLSLSPRLSALPPPPPFLVPARIAAMTIPRKRGFGERREIVDA